MNPIECIRDFLKQYPSAEFGPAHVVLSDLNLEDEFIARAIDRLCAVDWQGSVEEKAATMKILEWLLSVPEYEREEAVNDYFA